MGISTLGVWEHAEFEFLSEDGTHIMPMYVAVVPVPGSSNVFQSVEEVEVTETDPLEIEIRTESREAYLQIAKSK